MKGVKFIGKAKLTKQGQVTLPNEARQDLGICVDSEVYWYEIGDKLIVVKELVNPKDLGVGLNKKTTRTKGSCRFRNPKGISKRG